MARRAIKLPDASDVQQVGYTSDPGVRIPDTSLGLGEALDTLSRAGANVADAVAVQAQKQQRQLDANSSTQSLLDFQKAGQTEYMRLQTESDTADPAFLKNYSEYLTNQTNAAIDSLPEGVSQQAKAELRLKLQDQQQAMEAQAGETHLKAGQLKSLDLIDQQINVWSSQAAANPKALDSVLFLADDGLAPFAGTLSADAERGARVKARQSIIASAVSARIDRGDLAGARAILANDSYSADLTPQARITIGNQIEAEQKRLAAEAKAAAREKRAMFLADFNMRLKDEEAARARGTSTGLSDQEIRDALAIDEPGRKLADRTIADLNATQQLSLDMTTMATMTPQDQQALIDSYKPQGEGFADEAQRYDALTKARDQLNAALVKTPVAYVMTYSQGARDAYAGMSDPDPAKRKASTERYASIMESEQTRLGLQPEQVRFLSEDQANHIAAQFNAQGQGGETAATLSAALADQWGSRWSQVYAELGPKLPSAAVVIGSGMSPQAAADLAEAAKTGEAELKKLVSSDDYKTLTESVASQLSPFAQTVIGLPGGTKTLTMWRDNTELLALQYMSKGDNAANAARKAAIETVNRNYTFQDTYRVPIAYDPDAISTGARRSLGLLVTGRAGQVDIPLSLTGLPPEEARTQYLKALAERGYWVTDPENEAGLTLYGENGAAVTIDGKPYTKTWRELLTMPLPSGEQGPPAFREPEVPTQ